MSATPDSGSRIAVCPNCGTANRVAPERLAEAPTCGQCHQKLFPTHSFALSEAAFDRHVNTSDYPVVVDFWAAWCGPCRMMAPAYEDAAARVGPGVQLAKVDTDAAQTVASRLGIRSIPTMIAFRNGRELARHSGAIGASDIQRWIESNVAKE
ncbi:MAG TPA: thioredoxin TrxC [Casimicrobiaceae bacterium]